MRRIDKPVSEIGRHFQNYSVADEGLGGDDINRESLATLYTKYTYFNGKNDI